MADALAAMTRRMARWRTKALTRAEVIRNLCGRLRGERHTLDLTVPTRPLSVGRFHADDIIAACAGLYGLSVDELCNWNNKTFVCVLARQHASYALHNAGHSWIEVGLLLRARQHSRPRGAAQTFMTRPAVWRTRAMADLRDALHDASGTPVHWLMATNDPAMMLHRVADLLISGQVSHRAAGRAIRKVANSQHAISTPYRPVAQ